MFQLDHVTALRATGLEQGPRVNPIFLHVLGTESQELLIPFCCYRRLVFHLCLETSLVSIPYLPIWRGCNWRLWIFLIRCLLCPLKCKVLKGLLGAPLRLFWELFLPFRRGLFITPTPKAVSSLTMKAHTFKKNLIWDKT